ncbi:hypothetical protein P8452_60411 [Trifolium repens]|nr:hypothetical protein P8452_60411 [Trifolium repens]
MGLHIWLGTGAKTINFESDSSSALVLITSEISSSLLWIKFESEHYSSYESKKNMSKEEEKKKKPHQIWKQKNPVESLLTKSNKTMKKTQKQRQTSFPAWLLQFPVRWSLTNAFRSLFYFCEFCREHRES